MGRVLAVDPGSVRVGLAISDPLRITAQPLDVVPAERAVDEIVRICDDFGVEEIIVGLPTTESGTEGESAARARNLAAALEEKTGIQVTPIDERYTTRMAEQVLVDAGLRRRRRRQTIDKVAAAVLLRGYLDGGNE